MSAANQKQIGGNHYRTDSDIQHWDVVYLVYGGDYLLGNASKYMARIGKKGDITKSIEDLEKAVHYLQKKLEHLVAELKKQDAAQDCGEGGPTAGYVNQD